MEIISNGSPPSRSFLETSSERTWDSLKEDIAEHLDVHPNNLKVQYKFSHEAQKAIPIPLTSATDLKMLNERLQQQNNGRRKRPVSVIITARDSVNASTTTKKVRSWMFEHCYCSSTHATSVAGKTKAK
jgi:hypothetical protein